MNLYEGDKDSPKYLDIKSEVEIKKEPIECSVGYTNDQDLGDEEYIEMSDLNMKSDITVKEEPLQCAFTSLGNNDGSADNSRSQVRKNLQLSENFRSTQEASACTLSSSSISEQQKSISKVKELKGKRKKVQDSRRQTMLRRKTKSGDAAGTMKLWKYEELMSFLLSDFTAQETQSNVDVGDHSQNEDRSRSIDRDNQNEEGKQTWSEMPINIKWGNQKCGKNFNKFQKGDKEANADKILTLLLDKNKNKKRAGELDFFFSSACESTKLLPRHLQLKVIAKVMMTVKNAATECLDHQQFTSLAFLQ